MPGTLRAAAVACFSAIDWTCPDRCAIPSESVTVIWRASSRAFRWKTSLISCSTACGLMRGLTMIVDHAADAGQVADRLLGVDALVVLLDLAVHPDQPAPDLGAHRRGIDEFSFSAASAARTICVSSRAI
jgi:hypothetical protein